MNWVFTSNLKKGFSFVEMLVVLGILSVIGAVSISTYRGQQQASVPRQAAVVFEDALKEASMRAMAMEYDTAWGVRLISNTAVVFSGNSYAGRTTSRDKVYRLASTTISGPTEIVFTKFYAIPGTTGTTTFSNSFRSSSVYINTAGIIYQ